MPIRRLLCCVMFALGSIAPIALADPPRPNILFIIVDDQGWADVGYRGSEILTPHIDKLAAEGVRLEQHYVLPTCSPTRAGFLGGRYPSRFGVNTPVNTQAFPFDTVTLAHALKSVGYDTAITGKWHLGSKPKWGPTKFGFNHSHGSLAGGVDQYGHFYKEGPFKKTWHRNDDYIDQEGHATDLFADEAVRWIETQRSAPFFIYVAFTAVHIPLQEPREYLRPYDGKIHEPSRKLLAAATTHMDAAIGRMIDALERTNQRHNTLIVYTSDNGGLSAWLGTNQYEGGHLPLPILSSNAPLRGGKGYLYEGGIRVNAFVNWPAVLPAGKQLHAPIHIVDWFPTLCRLAGFNPSDDLQLDGIDIWPLLTGQLASPPPRSLYWKGRSDTAVRHGDWKLVIHGEKHELFDLAADPNETTDLAAQNPDKLRQLLRLRDDLARADDTARP